jgi:hypothetical protein
MSPDLSTRSEPQFVLDLLLHALRVRDERLNAVASELMTRFGDRPVRQLVRVALGSKNPPGYRIRALEVIARIKPAMGPDLMDLARLRLIRNKTVRDAAWRLLADYPLLVGVPVDFESRSRTASDTPADAANSAGPTTTTVGSPQATRCPPRG